MVETVHTLDSVFGDHQLVAGPVGAEARFASLPLGTTNEDIQHGSPSVGHRG